MSRFKNQAQQVIDHITTQCSMSAENVEKHFGISLDMIENRIEMIHLKTGMNGKKAADAIIQTWEASSPDYLTIEYPETLSLDGHIFRFKVLPKEIIVFFAGPPAYLHSCPHDGSELTESLKLTICTAVLKAFNEKTAN